MTFVFIRSYGDSALIAGLRLSIVPVILGATAPVGGVLYDRFGARIASVGMLICVASIGFLLVVLDGKPESLRYVMLALAMFGLGQGLFISPNNSDHGRRAGGLGRGSRPAFECGPQYRH
jgi:nitrate/nitrite transporter NarK